MGEKMDYEEIKIEKDKNSNKFYVCLIRDGHSMYFNKYPIGEYRHSNSGEYFPDRGEWFLFDNKEEAQHAIEVYRNR